MGKFVRVRATAKRKAHVREIGATGLKAAIKRLQLNDRVERKVNPFKYKRDKSI